VRVAEAYAAKTRGELAALTQDLPGVCGSRALPVGGAVDLAAPVAVTSPRSVAVNPARSGAATSAGA